MPIKKQPLEKITELEKLKDQNKRLQDQNKCLTEQNIQLKAKMKNDIHLETDEQFTETPAKFQKPYQESMDHDLNFEIAREAIRKNISKLTGIIEQKTIDLNVHEKLTKKTSKQVQNLIQQREYETAQIRIESNHIARLAKMYNVAERKKPSTNPVVRWFLNAFTRQKDTCFLASKIAAFQEKIKIRKELQIDFEKKLTSVLQSETELKCSLNKLRLEYDIFQDLRGAFQVRQSKIISLMTKSKLNHSQIEILNLTTSENYPFVLADCENDIEFNELLHKINIQNKSL